jgi:hypothetical protein
MGLRRTSINIIGLFVLGVLVVYGDSFGLPTNDIARRSYNAGGGLAFHTDTKAKSKLSSSASLVEEYVALRAEDLLSPRTIEMNKDRHNGAMLGCERMYPWNNFTDQDFRDAEPSAVHSWEKYYHNTKSGNYDAALHRPMIPFGLDDLARVSRQPLLTSEECQVLIDEADGISSDEASKGWMEGGARYGTPSDKVGALMPLERMPKSFQMINQELLPKIFSSVVQAFGSYVGHPSDLRLGGARVVRYDASAGQVELGMHRDFLALTVNIALNDPSEYQGGGTILEALSNTPIRLEKGHALIHPGDVRHAGSTVTSGTRYVLVLFLVSKAIIPHDRYLGEWAERCMGLSVNSREEEKDSWLRTAASYYADAYTLVARIDRGLFPFFYHRAGLGSPALIDEDN